MLNAPVNVTLYLVVGQLWLFTLKLLADHAPEFNGRDGSRLSYIAGLYVR